MATATDGFPAVDATLAAAVEADVGAAYTADAWTTAATAAAEADAGAAGTTSNQRNVDRWMRFPSLYIVMVGSCGK